ncbi:uncharacterized protein EI90DRAFT_3132205 [Cantharellus anzutake]|uniref:uncharacterized protein n=1 Tax=Cantharellus anzutake TaxID=1750568 RepID=UPI0019043D77|nr:uncharacterized protein EI90DRAFT_3132205 [Cantharellus anzutake]KAF8319899.1 hypothetical protein EI90DRAFT_3132205 [Cantharellus anzutake]
MPVMPSLVCHLLAGCIFLSSTKNFLRAWMISGGLTTIIGYNKTNSMTKHRKPIARFLHEGLSGLLLQYLIFIRTVEEGRVGAVVPAPLPILYRGRRDCRDRPLEYALKKETTHYLQAGLDVPTYRGGLGPRVFALFRATSRLWHHTVLGLSVKGHVAELKEILDDKSTTNRLLGEENDGGANDDSAASLSLRDLVKEAIH